ncbi:MAG: superinfection exclusion B family protein [Bdellovibrionaceae bacterium]|nr:superinfection exclusion B family protein [Pseudobdellovibrionaceae bacterium]
MKSLESYLKVIQLKPRFLFGLLAFGLIMILFPDDLATKFGFQKLRADYRGWIGIGTIAVFCMWLMQLIPAINRKYKGWQAKKTVLARLYTLSEYERDDLLHCIYKNQQTINASMIDGSVHGLTTKGILVMGTGTGNRMSWPYTIPDYIWNHIQKNKEELFPELFDDAILKELQRKWDPKNKLW